MQAVEKRIIRIMKFPLKKPKIENSCKRPGTRLEKNYPPSPQEDIVKNWEKIYSRIKNNLGAVEEYCEEGRE